MFIIKRGFGPAFKTKKMKIQKLIDQYKKKIESKDELIVIINNKLSKARRYDMDEEIEYWGDERNNTQRARQLYIQFIKDLEDLL